MADTRLRNGPDRDRPGSARGCRPGRQVRAPRASPVAPKRRQSHATGTAGVAATCRPRPDRTVAGDNAAEPAVRRPRRAAKRSQEHLRRFAARLGRPENQALHVMINSGPERHSVGRRGAAWSKGPRQRQPVVTGLSVPPRWSGPGGNRTPRPESWQRIGPRRTEPALVTMRPRRQLGGCHRWPAGTAKRWRVGSRFGIPGIVNHYM